jgi:nucleotide-binding universal stress UspA family protein
MAEGDHHGGASGFRAAVGLRGSAVTGRAELVTRASSSLLGESSAAIVADQEAGAYVKTMGSPMNAPATGRFAIVLGLDFTDADGPAFDQAARLAARVIGSELHLVHVFATEPSAERTRDLAGHLRLYVDQKLAASPGLAGIAVGIHLRGGKTVPELLRLAADVQADVIVVGSHRGPHIKDWLVGSTVEKLVSNTAFAVVVAAPKAKEPEAQEPVIEPACPRCVEARFASKGKEWWCERHAQAAQLGHVYSYQRELPFTTHDSTVSPTGIDF